ncbi:hypothetical protein [Leclercia sp. AS011]|uniref:hypothetical protein n=1 Tax=Leclercia sp. AS011 TaxID=3081257 RepID=UPI003019FEEA
MAGVQIAIQRIPGSDLQFFYIARHKAGFTFGMQKYATKHINHGIVGHVSFMSVDKESI